MKYMFDVELAKRYGTDEAIFLENLIFWVIRNRENEKNFFDGRTWTYNSVRALKSLFPFWSDYQMRRVLDSLLKQGVIVKGNYNKNPYDRTMWYALAEEEKLILRYQNFHLREPKNGVLETREPIPDIKPDIKPNIKLDNKRLTSKPETDLACGVPFFEKEKEKDTGEWVKNVQGVGQKDTGGGSKTYPHNNRDNDVDNNITDNSSKENVKRKEPEPDFSFTGKPLEPVMLKWLEYRKQIKKPYKSQMTIETCYKHLEDLSRGSLDLAEKIVEQSIANQWQGLFELKQGTTQPNGGAQNGGTVGKYAGLGRKFSNEA